MPQTTTSSQTAVRDDSAAGSIPRSEYPRPQFRRDRWLNLNGRWQFEFDAADSGFERGLAARELSDSIVVPFAPESELSGIGDVDFHNAVWYRRRVAVPAEWADERILLHFGAVDYDATVWVNGLEVGRHRGGFTSFSVDITDAVADASSQSREQPTEAVIVVRARDSKDDPQPRGKQSSLYANHDCDYTRTTGIWQSVWLEPVPQIAIRRPRITPELAGNSFAFEVPLTTNLPGGSLVVTVSDDAGTVASGRTRTDLDLAPRLNLTLPEDRVRPWSTTDPHLYSVRFELTDAAGKVIDVVDSYAGLRSVAIIGKAVHINGEPVFQRLVLDQGYYGDGIMTAPSDEALVNDIRLSLAAGFNGARLHQKVFEERFLYHADRLGYLVWGEFGDWGCYYDGRSDERQRQSATYITQWLEALERDYSHPSIVGWCPLNETRQVISDRVTALDDVTRGMFLATKAFDTSRPVLDASGYSHRVAETDIYDSHNYEQDPQKFAAAMAPLAQGTPFTNAEDDGKAAERGFAWSVPYAGQPYFCSEFGGIWWNPDAAGAGREESWGYGERPRTENEFFERLDGLVSALLDDENMFGYCYTQLTDVFQEQNGIYFFDRSAKFDLERVRAIQSRPAAIEKRS